MKPKKTKGKGVTPNTAQRRPGAVKHSPPKPFALKGGNSTMGASTMPYRPQGR